MRMSMRKMTNMRNKKVSLVQGHKIRIQYEEYF